jgi:hypothetical protein
MAQHYARHRTEQDRIRVVAFAFLTPFFFLKGGMSVSASARAARANLRLTPASYLCRRGDLALPAR